MTRLKYFPVTGGNQANTGFNNPVTRKTRLDILNGSVMFRCVDVIRVTKGVWEMKNQYRIITLLLLMILSFPAVVSAHGGGMGMMGHMDDDYRHHMMQGRGMMGGYGYGMGGYGMMGGYGYGMMGGMGPVMMLDLNDKQREEILDIQRDVQKRNWERAGEMMTLRNQLHDIMRSDNPDATAAGKVFDKMSALHKQMFMERLNARNKVMNKLNKQQREQLRQYGGPWMME